MELWPATSARRRPAPTQHVWSSTLYVAGPMPLWFMEWTCCCARGRGHRPLCCVATTIWHCARPLACRLSARRALCLAAAVVWPTMTWSLRHKLKQTFGSCGTSVCVVLSQRPDAALWLSSLRAPQFAQSGAGEDCYFALSLFRHAMQFSINVYTSMLYAHARIVISLHGQHMKR